MGNRSEKIDSADLVKDAKSVAVFLLPTTFESNGLKSHKQGIPCQDKFKMAAPEVAFFGTNFFIGEDKKSPLGFA